jgi:hypothetical protein
MLGELADGFGWDEHVGEPYVGLVERDAAPSGTPSYVDREPWSKLLGL